MDWWIGGLVDWWIGGLRLVSALTPGPSPGGPGGRGELSSGERWECWTPDFTAGPVPTGLREEGTGLGRSGWREAALGMRD